MKFGHWTVTSIFLFHFFPHLATIKQLLEEVLNVCCELPENTCRDHDRCDKVYDSWIRSIVKSVESNGFRDFSLQKLRKKGADIYSAIGKLLDEYCINVRALCMGLKASLLSHRRWVEDSM